MNRRELYAAGEPLGDGATRAKLGGGYVCGEGGGGGKSSSEANTSTQTFNTDRRQVVDGQSLGISGDGNATHVNIQTSDMGAISAAKDVALAGIANNSTNTEHLFAAAEMLFKQTANTLDHNVDLAGKLAGTAQQAYSDAAAQATGNKSLILVGLAIVGIAAVKAFGK